MQALSGDQVTHPAPTFQFTAIYEKVGWLYLEHEIHQPQAKTPNKYIDDIKKRLFEVTSEECGSLGRFHVVNLFVPGGRFLKYIPERWNKTLCSECAKLLGYYEPEWRAPM